MKNQYYGDINDYRKYGLLRVIKRCSQARLFINWMLTPDDTGPDGKFIQYLSFPDRWRHHDPEVFDILKSHVDAGGRKVSLMEESRLLSAEGYYPDIVPDDRQARTLWFEHFLKASQGSDLVFFDPDNGLEVKSVPFGSKNSSKYLYWHELEKVWNTGLSVILYQHFPRKPRSVFTDEVIQQVSLRTPGSSIVTLASANVLFLLAIHLHHASLIPSQRIVDSLQEHWCGEFRVCDRGAQPN